MSPQEFISKWGPGGPAFHLNERQGAQPHFIDLCQLLGVPEPGTEGDYLFEQGTLVLGESRGFADVFKRNHFAWENKAPGRDLDVALKQLLTDAGLVVDFHPFDGGHGIDGDVLQAIADFVSQH